MDIAENTAKRLVLVEKQMMSTILGFSLVGAAVILGGMTPFVLATRFYFFAAALMGWGILILMRANEKTFCTFDRESGEVSIYREPLLGKVRFEKYDLSQVREVRTVTESAEGEKVRFHLELEVEPGKWIPLTRHSQTDPVAFETLENKIRGYLI